MAAATGHHLKLGRLKKRSEFLTVAATNRRFATPGLVLQVRPLPAEAEPSTTPVRVGYTATKKVGNAVIRNRARRRLKAAVHDVFERGSDIAPRPSDLVLVARQGTVDHPYADLLSDLKKALTRLGVMAQ